MSVRRDGAGPESAASLLLLRESQARDDLERQLLCPICLEMFSKPVVILPCQHNLCRKCANDVFQSRGGGPSIGGGGRFRCPSCRHEVLLDRHGVYGLQRNLLVENIIDIYKQQQQQQQQSSRGSAAAGPGGRKDAEPHCAEHEEERVNIYCSSCRTPTCSLCKVFGSHQHCQVAPLGVVYEQHKGELSDGLAQVVVSSERLQEGLLELEGTLHSLDESSKLQQRVIGEAFEALSLVLEGRKRALTAAVQAQQEARARAIRARVARLAQRVDDASKLVEAALQLLDEPGAAKFLQSATGLIVRMSEVATAVDALPAGSGVDDLGKFRVDFSREADILRRLDFVPDEVTVEEKVEEPSGEVKGTAELAAAAEVAAAAATTAETMTVAAVAAGAQGEASVGPGEPPKTLGPEEGPPQPGPRGTNPDPGSNPNAVDSAAIDSARGERSREPEVRSYKIPSAGAGPRQDPPQPAATAGGVPRGPGVVRSAARGPPTSPSLWPGGGGGIPPRGGLSMKEERNDAGTMNGGVGGGTGAASRSSEGGRESLREERKDAGTTNGAGAGASTGAAAGAGVGSWWSEENPESSDGNSTFVFSFAWLNSQHK
ncbi:tripartite motif-containing protein 54-like [Petromyzon marinus]|uniref:Tripartite motif-containing protein 54-like n=1 Tax=Petromyzon marinus TaxID=7757 RepID=A0AAJ7TXC5_PETMA|nr:tripartite motif-containing protein 54-like [Petromyzon marinus]